MRSDHLLQRAGPFEVSEGMVEGLSGKALPPWDIAQRETARVAQLREELRESAHVIEQLRVELAKGEGRDG